MPRRDDSEILREVNRRWLSTLDIEKVLPAIASVCQKLLKADDVSVLLVDETGKELVEHVILSRTRSPNDRYRIRIRAEGITGWVAAHQKPVCVADVRKDSRYVWTSTKMRSEAAVPILAGDRLLGVINVESKRAGAFRKDSMRLLELLASQAAIAFLNLEAHDRERRRGEQLLILHHLARVAWGAIPPETFLQRVMDAVRREFRCPYAAVFLGDYGREHLVLLSQSSDQELEVRPGATLAFGAGLIGSAFKLGEIVNVRDVTQEPMYVAKVPEIRSELCVPIRVGDHCLGILDAQSRQTDAFSADDVIFLETLARFVVPSLQALAPAATS